MVMATSQGVISGAGTVQNTELNIDDLFDVLSNTRRRFVLRFLLEQPKPMAMADIVVELTKWERDLPRSQIVNENMKSRYIELHHNHVPKMEAAGLVVHNQDTNTIGFVDGFEEVVCELV